MLKHDLTGQRFGALVAREPLGNRHGATYWKCECDCGNTSEVASYRLRIGRAASCGCQKAARIAQRHTRHGHYQGGRASPEARSLHAAISRCHNPRATGYDRYGAAGIKVCDEWRADVAAFVAELGPRPPGTTLDRIDGSRGYEPGNCRWATTAQQAANRRKAKRRTHATAIRP